MKTVLLFLGLLLSSYLPAQLVAKGLTTSKGLFIGFYQFTPPEYDSEPNRKFPLIIFLHGQGERGNGTTELSKVATHGIPKHIKNGHPMKFFWNGKWESFIVLAPQLSMEYTGWQVVYVEEMIKYAEANLRIDRDRINLTGMSLGGGGTWGFANRTPENAAKLASLSTVCGTFKDADMTGVVNAKLPVWSFHATDDPTVSVNYTIKAINKINDLNPAVKPLLTIWPTGGHGIWDRAYDVNYAADNPNIYEWMLGQNKSLPPNILPVADAGPDLTVSEGTAVNLTGALSKDPDGKLVRFIWKKISGPAAGNISQPISEDGNTTVTGLIPGTYKFELRAIDDRAGYSSDTVTITVVNTAVPNIPPVVQTNDDQISFLTQATLDGSSSYDPDGVIVKYEWKYVSGPPQFTLLNQDQPTAKVINLSDGTYTFQLLATDNKGATSSGFVVIKEISSVLPVVFGRFDLNKQGKANLLRWTTLSESYNQHFLIQRSTDGVHFTTIGSIQGKDSSSIIQQYSFLDDTPEGIVSYYRIAGEGLNGKLQYTKILNISNAEQTGSISLYPVPATLQLTLSIQENHAGRSEIEIVDNLGRVVLRKTQNLKQGMNTITLYTSGLTPGLYFLRYRNESGRNETRKFIRQ